jgi:hypothetical protein
VLKKRNVRTLAAQSGATVAINGGFFAYGGAAVGAVKVNGEWHRLPWKSRTALGWDENKARIAPLSGSCLMSLGTNESTLSIFSAALNGFSLSGSHAPLTDGFAVLTPRFGVKYQVRADESCLLVRENRVVQGGLSGEVVIPSDGFLVIARGASRSTVDGPRIVARIGTGVRFQVSTSSRGFMDVARTEGIKKGVEAQTISREFERFPQILGAGPRLVENSLVKTTEVEEEFRPDVIARGPRTAIGWDKDRNWLFLVADGRQVASVGLTLPETAQLFQQLGAVEAMNLDGGSSTQLVINGELVNLPSGYDPVNPTRPREVMVSNALVLKPKN